MPLVNAHVLKCRKLKSSIWSVWLSDPSAPGLYPLNQWDLEDDCRGYDGWMIIYEL